MDAGALSEILGDRRRFISRLRFEDATANVASFSRPYSEQRALIEALMDTTTRSVVVLKPRQIGITTANLCRYVLGDICSNEAITNNSSC